MRTVADEAEAGAQVRYARREGCGFRLGNGLDARGHVQAICGMRSAWLVRE